LIHYIINGGEENENIEGWMRWMDT
jgi:hypothetical protein